MAQHPANRATARAVVEYLVVPLVVQPYEASFSQANAKLNGWAAEGWHMVQYNGGVAILERDIPVARHAREA